MDCDGERTSLQKDVPKVFGSRDKGSLVGRLSIVDELSILIGRQNGVAESEQLEELITVLCRVEHRGPD